MNIKKNTAAKFVFPFCAKPALAALSVALLGVFCPAFGDSALPYGKFVTDGPRDKACFALTFDDGPGESTKDVLAELAESHVKATFFMLGSEVKKHPLLVKSVSGAGHLVGNHTYTHANFNKVSASTRLAKLTDEVQRTSDGVKNITGAPTHFLRMPYGVTKQWVLDFARHHQHVVVNWTYGSDWESRPKEELLKEYLSHLNPGAILLMHDGGNRRDTTVWLVRRILAEAQKRHLRPVRVDTLLGYGEQASSVPSVAPEAKPAPVKQAAHEAKKSEPAPSVKPAAKAEPKPAPKPEPKPAPKVEPKPQAEPKSETGPKPETKSAKDEGQYEEIDESDMSSTSDAEAEPQTKVAGPDETPQPHKTAPVKAGTKPV